MKVYLEEEYTEEIPPHVDGSITAIEDEEMKVMMENKGMTLVLSPY